MKKAGIIFCGVALAFIALFIFKINDFYNAINTGNDGSNHKPTVSPQKTSYNILLLGYGGDGHDGAYLTDTIMIVHLDIKKNKALLISLPRDLWVNVPGKTKDFHAKINSVYEMGLYPEDYPEIDKKYTGKQGAAELAKYVAGQVSGLTIDNYVGVDFGGFKDIIDLVGGVDVVVEKTFDDYEYPIDGKEKEMCGNEEKFKQVEKFLAPSVDENEKKDFFKDKPELQKFLEDITTDPAVAFPCRYEHIHFDKGLKHMDGMTALKYARSRHSLQDGTDFGRVKRQQNVIQAVKEKVLSLGFLPKIFPLMEDSKKFVRMDLDFNQIKKLLLEVQHDSSNYKIESAVPSLDNYLKNSNSDEGQFILIPSDGIDQYGSMQKWLHDIMEGITPTPTPDSTATSSAKKK